MVMDLKHKSNPVVASLAPFDSSHHAQPIRPFHGLASVLLSLTFFYFSVHCRNAACSPLYSQFPVCCCSWHNHPSCLVNAIDISNPAFPLPPLWSLPCNTPWELITPSSYYFFTLYILLPRQCCSATVLWFLCFCLCYRAPFTRRPWLINRYTPK